MVHNSTFFMAVNPARRNDTAWQKTLGLNDWYEAGPDTPYPLGNLQMLGKLQAPMVKAARPWAPMWALKMVTDRSLDIYLTTEDLPRPDNRVTVDGDKIMISWTPNNLAPHQELVKRVSRAVRKAGYPIVLTERMGIATNSHMCGTAVAGTDPATSVLNPDCRSHDVEQPVRRRWQLLPVLGRPQPGADHRRERAPRRANHRGQRRRVSVGLVANSPGGPAAARQIASANLVLPSGWVPVALTR